MIYIDFSCYTFIFKGVTGVAYFDYLIDFKRVTPVTPTLTVGVTVFSLIYQQCYTCYTCYTSNIILVREPFILEGIPYQ